MQTSEALKAAGGSETGAVRHGNEDCFAIDLALGLFVVADGMGGHTAGEVASRLAVETITAFIRRSADDQDFSWPYGVESTLSYDGNRLRTAVHLANRRIHRTSESHDDYFGMGTTVAAVLVADGRLVVAHVGDSRVYRLREGRLEQLTRDDSWMATVLADDPSADPQLLANHPMRNVLTNALGAREDTEVHLQDHACLPGDIVLLCTDGIHGVLASSSIATALDQNSDVDAAAANLLAEALAQGSRDNVTALVVAIPTAESRS